MDRPQVDPAVRMRAVMAAPVEGPTRSTRPQELVHLVWLQALDADPTSDPTCGLALVQAARNDRSVLEHAIGYGRTHRGEHGANGQAARALDALEQAIALLRPTR